MSMKNLGYVKYQIDKDNVKYFSELTSEGREMKVNVLLFWAQESMLEN